MNTKGKEKDHENARSDLEEMGIRPELYVQGAENGKDLPVAATTMSRKEKKELCQFLQSVKFPSGYMPILVECEMSLGEVKVGLQKST